MSYMDRVLLVGLEIIDITARDDDDATLRIQAEFEHNDVEPVHVAQWLGCVAMLSLQQNPDWRALLDQQLAQARLIASANLPDHGPPLLRDRQKD